jgi:hypothetical protein
MINKCVCRNIFFSEVFNLLEFNTLKDLQEEKICADKCKLCKPYILEMIKTGKTEFP